MARIALGNREGLLAIRQGRGVLEHLTAEWPDLHITLRTVSRSAGSQNEPLLEALTQAQVGLAVFQLDQLPSELPEGLLLAAVARRGESRSALAARGKVSLGELPNGARVAVNSPRDAAFLSAGNSKLSVESSDDAPERLLARLANTDLDAVLLPATSLTTLDLGRNIDALLDESTFKPAPGQGAIGLVVREDDDLAYEIAYSLQHRPSFDRVRAERSFARALPGHQVGAFASVTDDGELTLLGAVVQGGTTLQATVSGEAREAEELAQELAEDVKEQLLHI